jgi:hypothetical protein
MDPIVSDECQILCGRARKLVVVRGLLARSFLGRQDSESATP